MLALMMPGLAVIALLLGVLVIVRGLLLWVNEWIGVFGGGLSDSDDLLG